MTFSNGIETSTIYVLIFFLNEFSCKNLINFIRKLEEEKNSVWVILSVLDFSKLCINIILHK